MRALPPDTTMSHRVARFERGRGHAPSGQRGRRCHVVGGVAGVLPLHESRNLHRELGGVALVNVHVSGGSGQRGGFDLPRVLAHVARAVGPVPVGIRPCFRRRQVHRVGAHIHKSAGLQTHEESVAEIVPRSVIPIRGIGPIVRPTIVVGLTQAHLALPVVHHIIRFGQLVSAHGDMRGHLGDNVVVFGPGVRTFFRTA